MGRLNLLIVLCAMVSIAADDAPPPPPKLPAAVAAIHKADAAVKAARDAYDSAVQKARKTEVDELKVALKVAMQKSDLQESNAINAAIKSAEANAEPSDSAPEAAPASPRMFGRWRIQNQPWVITADKVRDSGSAGGVPTIHGNMMLVRWPNGWSDQLTFEGDRVFDERFKPGQQATDPPEEIHVGKRETGG